MNPPQAIAQSPSDLVDSIICFLLASMNPPKAIALNPSDLESKFRALSKGILSDQKIDAVIELCWSIQDLSDVGQITRAASAD
jgi:hypothetical protein